MPHLRIAREGSAVETVPVHVNAGPSGELIICGGSPFGDNFTVILPAEGMEVRDLPLHDTVPLRALVADALALNILPSAWQDAARKVLGPSAPVAENDFPLAAVGGRAVRGEAAAIFDGSGHQQPPLRPAEAS